jgi:hypothetical protein
MNPFGSRKRTKRLPFNGHPQMFQADGLKRQQWRRDVLR